MATLGERQVLQLACLGFVQLHGNASASSSESRDRRDSSFVDCCGDNMS